MSNLSLDRVVRIELNCQRNISYASTQQCFVRQFKRERYARGFTYCVFRQRFRLTWTIFCRNSLRYRLDRGEQGGQKIDYDRNRFVSTCIRGVCTKNAKLDLHEQS